MNVEIGTEAAQLPEKEYINGIFIAMFKRYVCAQESMRLTNLGIGLHKQGQVLDQIRQTGNSRCLIRK
jgi:hypothetical protein